MIGIGSRKSLNDILSSFRKTIEDLNELQSCNTGKIGKNSDKILELEVQNGRMIDESSKAAKVQAKLAELIS